VLDGAENSPVLFWTSKHWEVCKVYSLTEQFWSVSGFIANKKWWDGLPKDIQAEMMAAGPETEKYFLDTYIALENKAIGFLKEKGVTVVTDVDKVHEAARHRQHEAHTVLSPPSCPARHLVEFRTRKGRELVSVEDIRIHQHDRPGREIDARSYGGRGEDRPQVRRLLRRHKVLGKGKI
jgi:hypothetical protein